MAVALQSSMVATSNQPRVVVLTPAQSAMVKAALSQHGGRETEKVEKPEPTKVSRGLDSSGQQSPGGSSLNDTTSGTRELGAQTLDDSVSKMINTAVKNFESSAGERSFSQVMMAELEANGIDSSQSFIDFYA